MKFIKTLLLCYLSLAVLLPSYQGFEEGQEFHFFEIMEAGASCHHYDTGGPELRATYETDHEHSIIYFVPPARIKKDLSQSGPPGQLIYRSDWQEHQGKGSKGDLQGLSWRCLPG